MFTGNCTIKVRILVVHKCLGVMDSVIDMYQTKCTMKIHSVISQSCIMGIQTHNQLDSFPICCTSTVHLSDRAQNPSRHNYLPLGVALRVI